MEGSSFCFWQKTMTKWNSIHPFLHHPTPGIPHNWSKCASFCQASTKDCRRVTCNMFSAMWTREGLRLIWSNYNISPFYWPGKLWNKGIYLIWTTTWSHLMPLIYPDVLSLMSEAWEVCFPCPLVKIEMSNGLQYSSEMITGFFGDFTQVGTDRTHMIAG